MTIAGSDSGGGAGIQADLKTFAAHGHHGTSALTAVTAQNSVGVDAWVALEPSMVVAQVECVARDMKVEAVKTGMLANAAIITAVADVVRRLALPNLVVDPVMVAKSGDRLLDVAAEGAYRGVLFPLAALITPNLPECETLLGRPVRTLEGMKSAARELHALGPRAVLVKGGHLQGEPIDVLYDGITLHEIPGARVHTRNTHGTGCTYAAAIASRLAEDETMLPAVLGARAYLAEAIRLSYAVGQGHGPLDQLHPLRTVAAGRP